MYSTKKRKIKTSHRIESIWVLDLYSVKEILKIENLCLVCPTENCHYNKRCLCLIFCPLTNEWQSQLLVWCGSDHGFTPYIITKEISLLKENMNQMDRPLEWVDRRLPLNNSKLNFTNLNNMNLLIPIFCILFTLCKDLTINNVNSYWQLICEYILFK